MSRYLANMGKEGGQAYIQAILILRAFSHLAIWNFVSDNPM